MGMPWRRTNAVNERTKFVLEWERRRDEGESRTNLSELCREFGISRETAYVWRRRRPLGRELGPYLPRLARREPSGPRTRLSREEAPLMGPSSVLRRRRGARRVRAGS